MSPKPPGNTSEPVNAVPSAEEAAAHIVKGIALFEARDYRQAIVSLKAGTEHSRFSSLADVVQAGAHAVLGTAWQRYGSPEAAEAAVTAFEKATSHRGFERLELKRQAEAYLNLGRALRDTNQTEDAVKALNKGIKHAGFNELEPTRKAFAKSALEMLEARCPSPPRFPVSDAKERGR